MEKIEKMDYASDKDIARLEEIDSKMDIISTRAIWLMGIMVLIVLAVISFLVQNSGTEANSLDWLIKVTARALCLGYSGALLYFIPLLIIPKFGAPIYEKYTPEEIQKNKEKNTENLEKLKLHFKTLIWLFISFTMVAFAVIGAGYVLL